MKEEIKEIRKFHGKDVHVLLLNHKGNSWACYIELSFEKYVNWNEVGYATNKEEAFKEAYANLEETLRLYASGVNFEQSVI